jgi:hypothetical protein
MTARKARATATTKAKANTEVLRCAQNDKLGGDDKLGHLSRQAWEYLCSIKEFALIT